MPFQESNHIKRLSQIDEQERKLAIERALTLEKAYRSGDVEQIYKAQNYFNNHLLEQRPRSKENPVKSLLLDPQEVATSMGYYHKATNLSYDSLRSMAKAPVISAIINTRKNQVVDFLKPQKDKYSKGFIIRKKGIDRDEDLTDFDKRKIEQLTEFMLSCGEHDSKYKWDRLENWGRKVIEDSLTLDQACFEIVPMRNREPYAFTAVDSATFRFADSYDNQTGIEGSQKIDGEYPSYVQLYQNRIIREFYPWELCFGVRNASSNIKANGYGRSELEDLVTTVTGMLNADKYNGGFFRHGSAPKGMLMVKKPGAALNGDRIQEFRKSWNSMLAGAENAHKTPILDAEGFEWIDLQKNNRDMEFFKYIEYLVKVGCAVYTISPEEIGFPVQGAGQGGGLGGRSSNTKVEKQYSQDKGLRPLLSSMEHWINDYIIGPKTNYTYEFVFTGMQAETAQEEEERLIKAATTYMEVNEIRKERGLKPKKGYDIILNPIISQQRMMESQMGMQQQQQGQEDQEKQQQQEDEQFNNTNPFLDPDNPFTKSFDQFVESELLAS